MPLKKLKKETSEELTLEWKLHIRNYQLVLTKEHCAGCQICTLVCPREAIELKTQPKKLGEKVEHAEIDIDLDKCIFCGICDILCPFGAIKVTVNGEHRLPIIEKESFPRLIRYILVDESKYPVDRVETEEVCPLDLIKITHQTPDGKTVEDVKALTEEERKNIQVKIEVQKERCPCCKVCEFKLPQDVMTVRKIFHGKIEIHQEMCPPHCTDCLDVCPITGALYLSDQDYKVHVNEMFCVYCGACKAVCPEEDALDVKRSWVRHTPVESGAWNQALENIASPETVTKELKAKGLQKATETLNNRLGEKRF
ncbi:MAG: 4Fe-4S dicluster domain-containing protein [Thermoproteota archaeon]